jgi:transcriptional regulator with GAF, ATPase, and Fis domain
VICAIVVDSVEVGICDDEHKKNVLNDFSREVSNVMELFEINQKIASNERRISRLYEIYEKLNLLEGKEKLIQTFFEEIKSFDISSGYIAEMLADNKTLEVAEVCNYDETIKGVRFESRSDEILRYVFDSEKSSVIDGVKGKNMKINFNNSKVDKFFIRVLKGRDTVYGVVKLDKKSGYSFTSFEIRTLEMILSRITMLYF